MVGLSPTEQYVQSALDAGCPKDQIRNFLKANLVLQPRQLLASAAARLCDADDGPTKVGYGGARGGGKSHWGIAQVVADDCTRFPGSKWLYLRKVGKSGREAIHDLRRSVLHSIPHEYKTAEGRIVLPNGSQVILGHFQCDKDVDNYLGLEYDGALIEEATQLSHQKVKDVGTCVRTSKPGLRPRMYYTTNPGNIGHAWFKALFILPLQNGTEATTRFVQATVQDNRFVNKEYRATLEALSGWQRKAWLEGDWDMMAGQFFTNWRREAVLKELLELPRHWRVWLSFDYGFQHYSAAYLLAEDGDGNVWFVDEHAEQGWLPEQHAAAIHAMLGRYHLAAGHLEGIFAGGDCFNKDRHGKSIADDYTDLGLTFTRANLDRVNRAAEWLRRLGTPEAVPPRPPTVFITPKCARLIECIPALQRDPLKPEVPLKWDVDDDGLGGDDSYDSSSFGLMHAAVKPTVWGADPFGGRRF